jgi:collagen type III alpha
MSMTFWGVALLGIGVASAQPLPGRGGPGAGGPWGPPQHPLLIWLDADKNGELSAEEINDATNVLKKLDKNADGKLTRDELPRLPFGPPGEPNREQFVERLRAMDSNQDGKLEKAELPERMQENFSRMDTNGDGYLDMEELKQVAARFGGRPGGPNGPQGPDAPGRPAGEFGGNLAERLLSLDSDHDGKISKEEAPERIQGLFSRLDGNSDGFLDKEEIKAASERVRRGGESPDRN